MSKADDGSYECRACGTRFNKAGDILSIQETEPKPKPKILKKAT
jgi:hypothetical protein